MEKFGVFIRSVGERTLELCQEAVLAEVPAEAIHVIHDVAPAWKAYDRMFELAEKHKYTWYLGLDADVVLLPGWRERAWQAIASCDRDTLLGIGFPVNDPFFGDIDRGTHFYTGRHTAESRRILREHTRFSPKPESSIRKHLPGVVGVYEAGTAIIGYHGHEQYFRDIYYRFWLQRIRQKRFGNEFPWLRDRSLCKDADHEIAYLGWQRGQFEARWRKLLRTLSIGDQAVSDISRRSTLEGDLAQHGFTEKDPLHMSLEEFLQRAERSRVPTYA